MDKSAIEQIQQPSSIFAAREAIAATVAAGDDRVALPEHLKLHDIERLLPVPIRFLGRMSTADIEQFVKYTSHEQHGAEVAFVNAESMAAIAHMDLGNQEKPGFDVHKAQLNLKASAEYAALQDITAGPVFQQDCAEWFEDWIENLSGSYRDGPEMSSTALVAAIRRIEIKAVSESMNRVESMSHQQTEMEKVEAKTEGGEIPDQLTFTCVPYNGLTTTAIPLRMSVISSPGGKGLKLRLRIKAKERIVEAWARELCDLLTAKMECPVYVGTFKRT